MTATWMCVECCLPDLHNGEGDGIGSCMCPRCKQCGECQHCADNLGLHHGHDDDDWWGAEHDPQPDDLWAGVDPADYGLRAVRDLRVGGEVL